MANKSLSVPKGTRDFGPEVMAKRNYILDVIKSTFIKFGFSQIETPSMELLETLTGKYGEEGDQLLYKILDSGDFLKSVQENDLKEGAKKLSTKIASKGLRYDLTVPFARFVANNYHQLTIPFKRFQIQPVWRADRPQKGRYREFYQCDADVVGSESLLLESEIVLMIRDVFSQLKLEDYTIKINNRKILSAFADVINAKEQESSLFVAIDKLDKIGIDKVVDELQNKGFTTEQTNEVRKFLAISGSNIQKIQEIETLFTTNNISTEGVEELKEIFTLLDSYQYQDNKVEVDFTLARGLSYYTGAIFEVKVNNVSIGSVSGGGRYDNLTGMMGLEGVTGVGFSFGIDRVYDVLEELQLFPQENLQQTQVLITHFEKAQQLYACQVANQIRAKGISCEIYPDSTKIKKQFQYANKKNIGHVIVIGDEEIKTGKLVLKDLSSGQQENLTLEEIIAKIA